MYPWALDLGVRYAMAAYTQAAGVLGSDPLNGCCMNRMPFGGYVHTSLTSVGTHSPSLVVGAC